MRITVDLDDARPLEVITAWHRLRRYGNGNVHGRVSSGGSGCHLKVHGSRRSEDAIAVIRRHCGDDGIRVDIDQDPLHPSPGQVLWDRKDGQNAGEWVDSLESLLEALYPPDLAGRMDYPGARSTVPPRSDQ